MRTAACAAALLLSAAAGAQTRDPMHPIVTARPAAAAASAGPTTTDNAAPRQLLVVDGRRYVIERGQRRAVGERLGGLRIVRIDDTAVVVRGAAGEQRLPLFAGVVKRPAADRPAPSSGTRP